MDLSEHFDCYIKIKNQVFLLKSSITNKQLFQIMSQTVKVIIPKLKIKLNDNNIYVNNGNNTNSNVVCNQTNRNESISSLSATDSLNNKALIKSELTSTNNKSDNNSLKELELSHNRICREKRRLSDNQLFDSIKRKKTNVDMNRSNSSEERSKENRNYCNTELSRGIGLPNMGNTCFLNSIIQVLRTTCGFTKFICFLNQSIKTSKNASKLNNENKKLIIVLHELFVHLGHKLNFMTKTNQNINSIIDRLINCQNLKDHFGIGQQHDSHEFLNWLINELNNYAEVLFPKEVNRELNSFNSKSSHRLNLMSRTITFQSFQGVMLRNIKCTECKRSSLTNDSFADIQIPLCLNEYNMDENENIADICELPSFSDIIHRTDYLKDDNKFECMACEKKTVASVINYIKVSPKILIICIKKPFEYSYNSKKSKLANKMFKVPLNLEYVSNSDIVKYDLYAVVMHDGSTVNNGHYYTVINSAIQDETISTRKNTCSCALNIAPNIGWIKINDDKVRKLNSSHVIKLLEDQDKSSTPYLAFYKRIN